jgi:hypothetical protein
LKSSRHWVLSLLAIDRAVFFAPFCMTCAMNTSAGYKWVSLSHIQGEWRDPLPYHTFWIFPSFPFFLHLCPFGGRLPNAKRFSTHVSFNFLIKEK